MKVLSAGGGIWPLVLLGLAQADRRHLHHDISRHLGGHTKPAAPPGLTLADPPKPSPNVSPVEPIPEVAEGAVADVELSFTILNLNYYDLEKNIEDPTDEDLSFIQMKDVLGEAVADTITDVFEKVIKQGLKNMSKVENGIPLPTPSPGPGPVEALLAVAPAPVPGPRPAPGPVAAPAAAPQAAPGAPQAAPAASPAAPAAAPTSAPIANMEEEKEPEPTMTVTDGNVINANDDQVDVYVSFRPGPGFDSDSFLQMGEPPRGTTVDVVITDKPKTGAHVLAEARHIVEQVQDSGLLLRRLQAAIFQATGMRPTITGLGEAVVVGTLKQWKEDSCESHMKKLVRSLEVAYTRRMVPMALYNECTNLIPTLSFSHDAVASPLDRRKCRIATIKFARRWDYGKVNWKHGAGKGPHEPTDYAGFCQDVCETRFGSNAPRCTVNENIEGGA